MTEQCVIVLSNGDTACRFRSTVLMMEAFGKADIGCGTIPLRHCVKKEGHLSEAVIQILMSVSDAFIQRRFIGPFYWFSLARIHGGS